MENPCKMCLFEKASDVDPDYYWLASFGAFMLSGMVFSISLSIYNESGGDLVAWLTYITGFVAFSPVSVGIIWKLTHITKHTIREYKTLTTHTDDNPEIHLCHICKEALPQARKQLDKEFSLLN